MAKSSHISSLDAHAGYWLRCVSNQVSHAFRLKVEAKGVTVAEWVVLRKLLEMGAAHASDLADALGMTRGAISKLIDRLVAKKLIKRSSEKADRRYQSLVLSGAGEKLVPALAELADQNDAEFFGHLGDQRRADLVNVLKEIVARRPIKSVPIH